MDPLIIAIDGPSGAGKGTVARAVAAALGYRHIDSGAMYRAVGWKALHAGVPLEDEAQVAALAERSRIEVTGTRVTIDEHDVTRAIRTPEIDRAATAVARLPSVRAILVDRQRQMGASGGIVMEGRDIGKALGLEYEDNEELKAADKVVERDKHRWELDPASAEDYKDRK